MWKSVIKLSNDAIYLPHGQGIMENANTKAATNNPIPAAEMQAESELAEPLWAVISFDRREASGVSFDQAVGIIEDLDAKGVSGLCIVTNEAASRLS